MWFICILGVLLYVSDARHTSTMKKTRLSGNLEKDLNCSTVQTDDPKINASYDLVPVVVRIIFIFVLLFSQAHY